MIEVYYEKKMAFFRLEKYYKAVFLKKFERFY